MDRRARPLALAFALATSACAPRPASPRQDASATPLACDATHPCPNLDAAIAAECAGTRQVTVGACGAYRELVLETDPTSVVYTKERRFYDGAGALVGTTMFVNEYGRNVSEGVVPSCPPAPRTPACGKP